MCAKNSTALRKKVVIHTTISHSASPPLNNHRERGKEVCMSKRVSDCMCCVCTCMCDRNCMTEAACDYAFARFAQRFSVCYFCGLCL